MRCGMAIILASCSSLNGGSLLDFSYGVLEQYHGNHEKAAEFYRSAYAGDPLAMPLVRRIATIHMQSGDKPMALRAYERVIAEKPGQTDVQIEFGDFLETIGRGDAMADRKREAAYLEVLKNMPGQVLPIERLIRMAREKGNDEKARQLLETLELKSPEAVRYYVATTRSLYDVSDEAAQKRIAKAFRGAMDEFPQSEEIARAASDDFREKADLPSAIAILEKHAHALPSSLDLRIRLGILHLAAGEDEKGLNVLREVLAIHPRKVLAHESLAKWYRKNNKADEARHHSVELLKIRGGTAEEFEQLAVELFDAGKICDARLLLEKAVFDHPENVKLLSQLAIATVRDPESKAGALRLFREAENVITDPATTDPNFLLEFSKELVAQGQNQAAEERLRKAIRMFPREANKETAQALRALAGIWEKENRNADAAEALISRAEALEK